MTNGFICHGGAIGNMRPNLLLSLPLHSHILPAEDWQRAEAAVRVNNAEICKNVELKVGGIERNKLWMEMNRESCPHPERWQTISGG